VPDPLFSSNHAMFLIVLALLNVVSFISFDLVNHVARNLNFHFHEQICFPSIWFV